MTDIDATSARRQFASLLKRASDGETFTITRGGYRVASLGPARFQTDSLVGTSPDIRPESVSLTTNSSTISTTTDTWKAERQRMVAKVGPNSYDLAKWDKEHPRP